MTTWLLNKLRDSLPHTTPDDPAVLVGGFDTYVDAYRVGLIYLGGHTGAWLQVKNDDFDDPNQVIKRDVKVTDAIVAWAENHIVSIVWDSGETSGRLIGWQRDDGARCIVTDGVAKFEDDPTFGAYWDGRGYPEE